MSIIRCNTRGCPNYTREGYADNPHTDADGMFCCRCRQRHKRQEAQSLRRLDAASKEPNPKAPSPKQERSS